MIPYVNTAFTNTGIYVCVYIYVYVCLYTYIYIHEFVYTKCVYIYLYIYTRVLVPWSNHGLAGYYTVNVPETVSPDFPMVPSVGRYIP